MVIPGHSRSYGRLCCSGLCSVWAGEILGVCRVVLGALEAEPRCWCPCVLLELKPPALQESVGLGCSSGVQQVVVADLSPPNGDNGGEGAEDFLSPIRGLGRGLCFTLGSGEEQGLERGLRGQGSPAGPAQGSRGFTEAPVSFSRLCCLSSENSVTHYSSLGTLGLWTSLCLSLSQLLAGATCPVRSIITQAHS